MQLTIRHESPELDRRLRRRNSDEGHAVWERHLNRDVTLPGRQAGHVDSRRKVGRPKALQDWDRAVDSDLDRRGNAEQHGGQPLQPRVDEEADGAGGRLDDDGDADLIRSGDADVRGQLECNRSAHVDGRALDADRLRLHEANRLERPAGAE